MPLLFKCALVVGNHLYREQHRVLKLMPDYYPSVCPTTSRWPDSPWIISPRVFLKVTLFHQLRSGKGRLVLLLRSLLINFPVAFGSVISSMAEGFRSLHRCLSDIPAGIEQHDFMTGYLWKLCSTSSSSTLLFRKDLQQLPKFGCPIVCFQGHRFGNFRSSHRELL